ncbi:hypothetical protein [Pseudorhodoferax sp. Leaf274]|uniref:hypothetical protein n=1 Tax=Pseudorhodoferax sp. Leaf274 TaxID=1736318 RepID=UPI000703A9B2|nr:hypothetical protein [Pseudorhodoferax sp. Leaf274]KQP49929.1 hypothetical protein ASF44_05005 [Pseudorhodoferax sp. Leaf274]
MALSTRQRWMLYSLAALLTGAAMLAVQPQEEAGAPAASLPATRPARAAPAEPGPAATLEVPQRPYAGAGRSPFGEPALAAAAAAQAAAAAAAAATPPVVAAAPLPTAAAALPFRFLGRWTEDGVSTVFLAHGPRQLAAVAGRHLTPDYLVEHIGTRELRLLHVPTGTRHALALVASPGASAPAAGPAPAAADTEEQN